MPSHQPQPGRIRDKLWLLMLKSGERFRPIDAQEALGEHTKRVCWMLSAMVRDGAVSRFPVPGKAKRFTYGVTTACKIPRSVNLGQVAECLAQQAQEEEVAA